MTVHEGVTAAMLLLAGGFLVLSLAVVGLWAALLAARLWTEA